MVKVLSLNKLLLLSCLFSPPCISFDGYHVFLLNSYYFGFSNLLPFMSCLLSPLSILSALSLCLCMLHVIRGAGARSAQCDESWSGS